MTAIATVKAQIQPEKWDDLTSWLKKNLPDTRARDGIEWINVYTDPESHSLFLVEKWDTVESHQAYVQWRTDNGTMGELGSMLSAPPEISYWTESGL